MASSSEGHFFIPETTQALFTTPLFVRPFQLEQHCRSNEEQIRSSFIAETAEAAILDSHVTPLMFHLELHLG